MSDIVLGKLIDGDGQRDAVHVAIAPVEAGGTLYPGQRVGFTTSSTAVVGAAGTPVGIVDPYLTGPVFMGQRFYLFLFPNTVTSLRHEWTHPAFDDVASVHDEALDRVKARARIAEIAAELGGGMDYDALMKAADKWLLCERSTTEYGSTGWQSDFPRFQEEFWALYEIVAGNRVAAAGRGQFFSCSC